MSDDDLAIRGNAQLDRLMARTAIGDEVTQDIAGACDWGR